MKSIISAVKSKSVLRSCNNLKFSSNQMTAEEIQKSIEFATKHKKFVTTTVTPKTLSDVVGTGDELHIPQKMSEIAVLSGMPSDQQKRTVLIIPLTISSMTSQIIIF